MKNTRTIAAGLLYCLTLYCLALDAYEKSQNGYHFSVYEKIYPLATYFTIESDDSYCGSVKKSIFRIRTNYDLSNSDGWQATGIKRMLSLGSIYPWATEVDVYDTRGDYLGMIDGQVVSTAAARFSIYDLSSQLCGIAYLDHSLNSYSIVYPDSEAFPIVELHRHLELDGSSWWSAAVYDEAQIDPRILRVFAAMVCDIHPQICIYYGEDIE